MRAVDTIGRVSCAYEDFQDKILPYVDKALLFSPVAPAYIAKEVAEALLKKLTIFWHPENMPTYNLFHPSKQKFLHSLTEVAPWVLWGNSPDDPTAMLERIVTPLVLEYYEKNVLNRNNDSSGVPGR